MCITKSQNHLGLHVIAHLSEELDADTAAIVAIINSATELDLMTFLSGHSIECSMTFVCGMRFL